jgi:periplasmic divalent cation tolerance protein
MIADALIQGGAGAAVHITEVESRFTWGGKLVVRAEFIVSLKTTAGRAEQAVKIIKDIHTYDLPGILMTNFEPLTQEYSQWLENSHAG